MQPGWSGTVFPSLFLDETQRVFYRRLTSLGAAGGWLRRPVEARRVVIDVTAWYWHFMALLWLYIFTLLEIAR